MHACGHDNHVAILMGAAEVMAGMRTSLARTVVLIFHPAEEGLGGAANTGATNFTINVKGRQTHGSQPWLVVDPIIVSAQILLSLQTIASRQVNVAKLPSVITVVQISGGNRYNNIPDSVVMHGTLRVFDDEMKRDIEALMTRTAEDIVRSAGATSTVTHRGNAPITYNDPALTARMLPTFQRVTGAGKFLWMDPVMPSEDFPEFTKDVPGVYFFLGIVPEGQDPATAPANHSPLFYADEGVLDVGMRAMVGLAVDFLAGPPPPPR